MNMDNVVSYFSGGPAKIPNEVLEQVSRDVLQYGNTGVGVLEISHRSPAFLAILDNAITTIKELLDVPPNYRVAFFTGGGNGQFSAVPLNLMNRTGKADYIVTGTWSKSAAIEAAKYGTVQHVLPEGSTFMGVPDVSTWKLDPDAAYLYYCDNETIQGVEFATRPVPPEGVPLVCDMSSNICSRPVDISKFGLIFAGAQKNIGCAGVTLVIIREDLLDAPRSPHCPVILDYAVITNKNSNYNTPPVYAIHVLGETVSWVKRQGGIEEMKNRSDAKSKLLYSTIDSSQGFYVNEVKTENRSRMNVVFTVGAGEDRNKDLEAKFVEEAGKENLKALKGHRDVGGMRASIFNAVGIEHVRKLVVFMDKFRNENSENESSETRKLVDINK
uniref:Phosphoserine aminotransferase n=1 Tax=Hirondellea gigas TaxID=1518452 RepID=A0A2P2HYX6_9CRUS